MNERPVEPYANTQPGAPRTDMERYYEACYMHSISKPGSSQEKYWKERVAELERVTLFHTKH